MKTKIKILQIANTLGAGGTERNLQNIASTINKEKFEVYNIGFFDNKDRGEILKDNNLNSLTCHGDINKLEYYIQEYSIDILLIHRAGNYNKNDSEIINLAKKLKMKLIAEINVFGLYDESTYKDIHLHFHVSKTSLLKYINNKQSWNEKDRKINYVIYNGLDLENIDKALTKIDISNLKKRYGIENDDFVISRIARPDMYKWTDLTTIVLLLLHRNNKKIKFVFRSIPNEREKIIKRILKNNFVNLPITLDEKEILATYKIANLTLNFSKIGESFGYSIAESMYLGIPVISNITANKDNAQIELIDNDKNGFIVNGGPIYITKIINNIIALEKKYKDELSKEAHKKIESNYNVKKSTKSLETYLLLYLNISNIEKFYYKAKNSPFIYPSIKEINTYKTIYAIRLQNYQKIHLNIYAGFLDLLLFYMIKFIDRVRDAVNLLKSKIFIYKHC
ncbi:MAG: glycosyltransferase [Patescibacteria group bacterium]